MERDARLAALLSARFGGAAPVVIGDLGCTGVDVAEMQRTQRAPVFPGQWNRWILARTTRDNPDQQTILDTTRAFFLQAFRGVFATAGASPADVVAVYHLGTANVPKEKIGKPTTRHGPIDLLDIVQIDRKEPTIPTSQLARLPDGNPASRTYITPLPTIAQPEGSAGPVFVTVDFVWRGTDATVPWPVHKQQILSSWCPFSADWALWYVLKPLDPAVAPVPPELTPAQKAGEEAAAAAEKLGLALAFPALLLVVGVVSGAYLARKLS